MDIKGKKILVFGAGISGIGASVLAAGKGADVVLYDGNDKLSKDTILASLAENAAKQNIPGVENKINIILGELPEDEKASVEIAVLSPGIPCDIELVKWFKAENVPVIGEVELAYQIGKGKVYAVTGTNGKTTTTTLLGEIMKAANPETYVVGNIGFPYTDYAAQQTENAVTVAEISSFQLETIDEFHPAACTITNITEDHLNRHHTMAEYIRVKERIAENLNADELCVLNYEDEVLREFGKTLSCKVCYFSSLRTLDEGIYLENGSIIWNYGGEKFEVIKTDELQIIGLHNFENVMCASAIAIYAGVDHELIRKVLAAYPGTEHRIEFVGEFDGVVYYNDSKGTNPDAAIKGIQAMKWPTLLIGGGFDKGSSYEGWINNFDGKVKYFVLIGQTKEKIAAAARNCGMPESSIILCEDLKEAVEFCKAHAVSGDAVLLSPACASWGQFKCYEQRGDMFKAYVRGENI